MFSLVRFFPSESFSVSVANTMVCMELLFPIIDAVNDFGSLRVAVTVSVAPSRARLAPRARPASHAPRIELGRLLLPALPLLQQQLILRHQQLWVVTLLPLLLDVFQLAPQHLAPLARRAAPDGAAAIIPFIISAIDLISVVFASALRQSWTSNQRGEREHRPGAAHSAATWLTC